MNQNATGADLRIRKCLPCEGGIPACSADQATAQLGAIPNWRLSADGKEIQIAVRFKDFSRALECLNAIAAIAEEEQHHPDLHLTGYRNLSVALSTHAIGGLSDNDFIVAAKIDALMNAQFPDSKLQP